MGLRARFSVIDDLGYPASTPELGLPIDYSEGCERFVEAWLEAAIDMVPVDTGYLQSTLDASSTEDECICETLCDYAQYVEYGTYKMEAQPYFEPALEIAMEEAVSAWDEALDEALEEEQEQLEEMEEMEGRGGNRWRENDMIQRGISGGFGATILGTFAAAIVVGLINVALNIAFGLDNSGGGRGGNGHLYSGGSIGPGGGYIDVEII